ncbi:MULTISPECIES: hypothetical protein [unclassified Mycolicibacterium]|uniref:hypothetical protein n=1 Tax=unclassified Mycolicibacterium TaxID=2636767 RepID=UPI0012DE5217|nr:MULTISPECIES: hypothetical protein [unclassified Mycolicibacterium]MUL84767.1 hypothetical protein [Mycolicibacterium sp. CBMA 329]MUL88542.1 hypothetical protein [Mycolicibacterium sp. CBMA 331]MUM00118.1 hypothetical protein [Mycolicibacterium sp. CBMA 334]MUM27784.1 hypothetical protein [Mycolicibacterium sp. CBMA 295]MUM40189.1 hypothetical protein [Mycolicibacterium sp. CBMA 247]
MSEAPAGSVLDELRALLGTWEGTPPLDAVERLGGWQCVVDGLRGAPDDPASVVLVRIAARCVPEGGQVATEAVPAIVDAVAAMESPAGFAESLNALLEAPAVLDVAAEQLADALLEQVGAFARVAAPNVREVSRAASALEAVTRLKVGGYGSPFGLFAALERFKAPMPKRVAAAIVRSVGTVVDHWPEAVSLVPVVERVAGLAQPSSAQVEGADPQDVASDASWVLANVALVQALRADTREDMLSDLELSVQYFGLGVGTYDRDDAKLLAPIVEAVAGLVRAGGTAGGAALDEILPTAQGVKELVERQARIDLGLSGLNHWYADVKRQASAAWVMLIEDLGNARKQLSQAAFYRPEAAIDDLLQVYRASRSVEVVRREDDFNGVLTVVQPIIETGFASNMAFLSNLSIYATELTERIERADDEDRPALVEQQCVAEQVLAEARTILDRGGTPGKDGGGAATTPLPPQLENIFGSDPEAAAEISALLPATIEQLVRAVENTGIARRVNLQEDRVLTTLQGALSASPDYVGQVKDAVDEVILQMVRFVGSRQNAQKNRRPYLFDPNADEAALHDDLFDYLWSALGQIVDIEVPQIGGGRVDLRVKYASFSIYLEVKVDDTKKALSEKGAYLNQAATYQATDVRIGFVVALRTRAYPTGGAHPHLTSLFTHAVVDVEGDEQPRQLVLVDVPGNRSSPAAKKAKT